MDLVAGYDIVHDGQAAGWRSVYIGVCVGSVFDRQRFRYLCVAYGFFV